MPPEQEDWLQETLNLHRGGTVGGFLEQVEREALNTTQKGEALELVFREIAWRDPALEIEEIDLYSNWARQQNHPRFLTQDKGIDLVARLRDGTYAGIQCKFYEQAIRLININSFLRKLNTEGFGGRPFFSHGWIVSTAPLGRGVEEELASQICSIRHIPISRYSNEPLRAGFQFEKKELWDFQADAVEKIKQRLPIEKRGKLVMACGTGKTFTALRAMERIVPLGGRVLVCAPSIALVSQIREEWLRQTDTRLDARVVCSDAGAGRGSRNKRESVLAIQYLQCPVTTNPEDLAEFLKEKSEDSIKVIITTYQSLIRVQEAQQDHAVPDFNLAIADEAHKTTGASKVNTSQDPGFRMIHKENDIRADMRLYMTATPRVYSNAKSLESRGYEITDMGDTDIYGNTLYSYGFSKAVESKYLCDYRLIMLGVHRDTLTPSMIDIVREAEDGQISEDDMTRVFGAMLAVRGNSLAHDSTRTGILHRTIAFANSRKRSRFYETAINNPEVKRNVTRRESDLAEDDESVVRGMDISCRHLDGNSQVVERISELRNLQEAKRNNEVRILSNVGIFSEGVDVPSLNAVAFLDPRKSKIDIIQAVGRVMRRPENPEDKSMGYIIVPAVVPEGSTLEEAILTTPEEYQPVLAVIAALQSHDETLLDNLKSKLIINEISSKRNGYEDDSNDDDDQIKPLQGVIGNLSEEARQRIVSFIVAKSGLTRQSKGKIAADGIRFRVMSETSKMLESGIGPNFGRLLSVPENKENGWKEACTLASLLLLNAMLVHHRIQGRNHGQHQIGELSEILPADNPARALRRNWEVILDKDYRPIFEPALSVLGELENRPGLCRSILRGLVECATTFGPSVSEMGWDHAGPLYHSVLGTAKSDGAFYTNNVSALMLAQLSINDSMADWEDLESIARLRVMDPACGTGTLLMAVLQEMKRRAREANPDADLDSLHQNLVENSLAGLDINRHATQLAASNLTISSESVDYDRMHIYTMRHGVQDDRRVMTGSLELLDTMGGGDIPQPLFQTERTLAGVEAERSVGKFADSELTFPCRDLDLVIMNPPFTNAADRAAHLSPEDRDRLQNREKRITEIIETRDPSLRGVTNFNSIATYFTPLADMIVRNHAGTMAKIIPATACTGSMGLAERRWIASKWHVERIVSNHDPRKFMFSENTDIHEVLLICRRRNLNEDPPPTEHVSLCKRPENEREAHECIEAILGDSEEKREAWCTRGWIPAARIATGYWRFVQWHQPDLEKIIQTLESHPELVPLGSIATMGPTGQQTRGTWKKCEESEATAWSFYSKSGNVRQTIRDEPEQPVRPKQGSNLNWTRENEKASNLLVTTGAATDSGRVMAIYTDPPPGFGSAWQPVLLHEEANEPAMAGWLNSTPGRLLYLNRRARKLTFPQYSSQDISTIPVPRNLEALDDAVRSCWNRIMLQGRDSAECGVRATLDDAAARILGIPSENVHWWRRLLAQEPTVSGKAVPRGT